MEKVSGEDRKHDIKLFAVSTCAWCKRTKKLLKSLDVEFRYWDLDLLSGDEREEVEEEFKEYNPKMSTPTLVIDGGEEVIIGYQEDRIREVLGD